MVKLAFTFLMTARGVPLVYYGDEIAMAGGGDPDNRRDFPGGFRDDSRNAFTEAGRTPDEQSVLEHVRTLARLRAELGALRGGSTVNLAVDEQTWAYARKRDGQTVVVALNNATAAATIDAEAAGLPDGTRLVDRLGSGGEVTVAGGRLRLGLAARSAAVFAVAR